MFLFSSINFILSHGEKRLLASQKSQKVAKKLNQLNSQHYKNTNTSNSNNDNIIISTNKIKLNKDEKKKKKRERRRRLPKRNLDTM